MSLPTSARLLRHKVNVEWARGTAADLDAYEDVTGDVLISSLSIGWGRDQARSTAPPRGENLGLVLTNHTGKYNNVSGPLAGFVNKGPLVNAYMTHTSEVTVDSIDVTVEDLDWTLDDPEQYPIFGGQITLAPQSIEALKTVHLSAIGALRHFTRKKITIYLLENVTVDYILNRICDLVGFPADKRIFDTGDTTIQYFWMADEVPLSKMIQLLATEGSNALLITDNEGNLRFQGRQYRAENYRSTTVQFYLYDKTTGIAPNGQEVLHSPPTTLNQNPEEAFNKVSTKVNNRQVATGLTQVFSYGGTITLSAGETKTIYTALSVPVKEAVAPVLTTDYLVSGGSVASTSLEFGWNSGTRIGIIITAGGSGATITGPTGQETEGLKLRAKIVSVLSELDIIQTTDTSASIARYEEVPYEIPLWPEINPNQALDIVNGIATRYKEPREQLSLTIYNTDVSSAMFILRSQISDRINVVSTHQGIDANYFIETKQLKSIGNGLFECSIGCEKAIDVNAFRFGVDNFGGNVFGE